MRITIGRCSAVSSHVACTERPAKQVRVRGGINGDRGVNGGSFSHQEHDLGRTALPRRSMPHFRGGDTRDGMKK